MRVREWVGCERMGTQVGRWMGRRVGARGWVLVGSTRAPWLYSRWSSWIPPARIRHEEEWRGVRRLGAAQREKNHESSQKQRCLCF